MRIALRVFFVLGCLIAVAGAQDAQASGETIVEVFFYDYGSYMSVGEKVDDWCGGWHWEAGDTTNFSNGELKVVRTYNCFSHQETFQWWRWQADCTGGYWYMIADPYWDDTLYC